MAKQFLRRLLERAARRWRPSARFGCARTAVLLTLFFACLGVARAHDLPVNRMVNAFVHVQGHQADLIARVPTDLLRGVPFPTASGHYDLAQAGPSAELATLLLADSFVLAENGARLTPGRSEGRLVAVSDRSFDQFDHALESERAPIARQPSIPVDSGYLVVHFIYPVASDHSRFEIQSQIAVDVGVLAPLTVRFQRGDDVGRAMIVAGGADPVDLDPLWYRAAGGFVVLGIEHILSGTDHLLFLLCLVVPVRRLRDIVPVITAFTAAHSVTLIASAMGLAPRGAWFPPLVEAAIAASIVYTAIENIVTPAVGRRWLISCLFGLIHGFGFSNALGDSLQFAGKHLLVSLLAFNVGIEAGQLGVLFVGLPVLVVLRRWFTPRAVVVVLSVLGGALGGVWLFERWQILRKLDATCSSAMCMNQAVPWLVLVVAVLGVASMISVFLKRRPRHLPPQEGIQ
jgi:hypothetical protein